MNVKRLSYVRRASDLHTNSGLIDTCLVLTAVVQRENIVQPDKIREVIPRDLNSARFTIHHIV